MIYILIGVLGTILGTVIGGLIIIWVNQKNEKKKYKKNFIQALIQLKEFINYSIARVSSITKSPPFEKTTVMRARIELTDWLLLYPIVLLNSTNHQFIKEISNMNREFKVYNEELENGAQKISEQGWSSILQTKAQDIMKKLNEFLRLIDNEIDKIHLKS